MPAAVISIGAYEAKQRASGRCWKWRLSGSRPVPYGILLVDEDDRRADVCGCATCSASRNWTSRSSTFCWSLRPIWNARLARWAGRNLLDWLEDSAVEFHSRQRPDGRGLRRCAGRGRPAFRRTCRFHGAALCHASAALWSARGGDEIRRRHGCGAGEAGFARRKICG